MKSQTKKYCAMALWEECGVFGEPVEWPNRRAYEAQRGLIPKCKIVSIVTGNGLKDTASAMKTAGQPMRIEPDISA